MFLGEAWPCLDIAIDTGHNEFHNLSTALYTFQHAQLGAVGPHDVRSHLQLRSQTEKLRSIIPYHYMQSVAFPKLCYRSLYSV